MPLLETFANASARGYETFGPAGASSSYELISTTTLSGYAGSVTFSSIPSTYKHLELRMSARNTTGNDFKTIGLRFNGDTGGNSYSGHRLYSNPTISANSYAGGLSYMPLQIAGNSQGNGSIYGGNIIQILDYANTNKNTTAKTFSWSTYGNGSSYVSLYSGGWANNSAVNSITILDTSSDSFFANSRFSLYGIKG